MELAQKQIQADIIDILNEMTKEWDHNSNEIGPKAKLVEDLGFSSIDLMHLMASVDMHFKRKFPYDKLILNNGQYVEDISVEKLVRFVVHNFDEDTPSPVAM